MFMFFYIFYCRMYNYMYLCTNKGKNMTNHHKVNYSNFANSHFVACNVEGSTVLSYIPYFPCKTFLLVNCYRLILNLNTWHKTVLTMLSFFLQVHEYRTTEQSFYSQFHKYLTGDKHYHYFF